MAAGQFELVASMCMHSFEETGANWFSRHSWVLGMNEAASVIGSHLITTFQYSKPDCKACSW